jgi:16S rRNA (adenine1518-N6/adenine1519-N6)-dimethyltransferase
MPKVIVVDEHDNPIGTATRPEVKSRGLIHRIVRVFVFNPEGKLLLQQRSQTVDFPGLWDQSVGGHVDAGEDYETAAKREAQEELGLDHLELLRLGKYYTERENPGGKFKRFNMVYRAETSIQPTFDPEEVAQVRWVAPDQVDVWSRDHPEEFTKGFLRAYEFYKEAIAHER